MAIYRRVGRLRTVETGKHLQVSLATDASSFRYGISLMSGKEKGLSFGDFWSNTDDRPIHLKEASAVIIALQALEARIKDRN